MKKKFRHILPVICILGFTIVISLVLYSKIMEREEAVCWQLLNDAAESVNNEITMKFEDERTKLRMLATIMIQDDKLDAEQLTSLHLDTFQTTTIFQRIDVLFPDNTLVSDDGTPKDFQLEQSFIELVAKKEHISQRETDIETGRECVYYYQPVKLGEDTVAILIGVIDAKTLSDIFQPTIYNDQANCCIIDSSDGNYILDSWHDELGNAYNTPTRKRLKGYETVDLKEEIKSLNTGAIAFESRTTGEPLYMYYTPMNIFDWELAIFAEEKIVFANLLHLKKLLLFAGLIEAILLICYFVWNLITITQLEKSKVAVEKQQEQLTYMSYRDMLTCQYNRNKYMSVLQAHQGKLLQNTGVAYIDLNGLKQINDLYSHTAGDNFIQSAASAIATVFPNMTYRIGGDEFVVLNFNIDKKTFTDKTASLLKLLREEEINVSTGFMWKESCDNLDMILKEAETLMYEEKELYYQTHDRRCGSH